MSERFRVSPSPRPTYDYAIVGAGSAGCVLARRLSDNGASVLLVEAGQDTPPGSVPADIQDLYPRSYYNRSYMWPGVASRPGRREHRYD